MRTPAGAPPRRRFARPAIGRSRRVLWLLQWMCPPQRGPTANRDPTATIQPRGTNPYGSPGSIADEYGVCQYILTRPSPQPRGPLSYMGRTQRTPVSPPRRTQRTPVSPRRTQRGDWGTAKAMQNAEQKTRKPEAGNRKEKQGITARSFVASLLRMTARRGARFSGVCG